MKRPEAVSVEMSGSEYSDKGGQGPRSRRHPWWWRSGRGSGWADARPQLVANECRQPLLFRQFHDPAELLPHRVFSVRQSLGTIPRRLRKGQAQKALWMRSCEGKAGRSACGVPEQVEAIEI